MARQSGLSTFTSYDFRSFETHIVLDKDHNIHYVYEQIRTYVNTFKINLKLCVSSEVMFYENKSYDIVKVTSIIEEDNINDNDVFEMVYTFLEHMFVLLSLSSLTFVFKGFNEYKTYKILKNSFKK